ncbi:MAG: ABC transporter ATP-binding protein [Herpetosiphon sp.]
MVNVIELRGVSKRYGTLQAVYPLDLDVQAGEVVGFLGANGAGKTTTISMMLGLCRPTDGTVHLFGQSPIQPQVRSRVGVMLQESGVPGSLRVGELIRLFQSYYPYTLPTDELLHRAGLEEKRNALVSALSGGQKQRLYFALALAGDPELLCLDEPTAGMDVESRLHFWEQIRGFTAIGKTILFSTHYLEEADALATRIIVIDKGRVVAQGTPSAIKGLAADKQVIFRTNLPADRARSYPGVRSVQMDNGAIRVATTSPELFLRRVFGENWEVAGLRVEEVDLETAFLSLTEEVQV